MRDLLVLAALFVVAAVIYRFRAAISAALRRFDARYEAQRREELRDRSDRFAHYKHTIRLANEQIEEVTEVADMDARTGQPVARFLFEGTTYPTREEAEAARETAVLAKARAFYEELPEALGAGRGGTLARKDPG